MTKKPKPVKAWAEFDPHGRFIRASRLSVGQRKSSMWCGYAVVRVLITPIGPTPKKGKK